MAKTTGMAAMNRRYYARRHYARLESHEQITCDSARFGAVPERGLRTEQELYYDGAGVEFAPQNNAPLTDIFRR